MTAKVNLLPSQTREASRQATARIFVASVLLVVLLGLGGLYWLQANRIADAEDQLAMEQDTTLALRAEQAELQEFADLEARLRDSAEVISAAMDPEISVAGFLQDLALVTPSDAQFETLNVTLQPLDPEASESGVPASTGSFTVTGRTLTSHAPGVERLLLQLEKVANFQDIFLNTSLLEDREEQPELEGVVNYSLEGNVNENALTRRYTDGLPEVFR